MKRGTTPAVTLSIDADLTDYSVYVAIKGEQGEPIVLENDRLDVQGENGKCTVTFALTQEETLALAQGMAEVQVRAVHDGTAIATDIKRIPVGRIIQEGVIDG